MNTKVSTAEIVARALERIAEGGYTLSKNDDDGTEVITIFETDETPDEHFAESLAILRQWREKSGEAASGIALEDEWSDQWTLRLLVTQCYDTEDVLNIFPLLEGKCYRDVLTSLYELEKQSLRDIQGMLGAGRETIRKPTPPESLVNSIAPLDSWTDLRAHLTVFHARRLSKQFPKIVDRAEKLSLLRTDYDVPDGVRQYIEQASACYLQGLLIACLIVCRSAIEFAVRDRLKALGHGSELDSFEKSKNGDSLKWLIELAKRILPWQFNDVLEDSHKIREVARRAVHVESPDEDECREMFILTRTIVHTLYTTPQSL